MDEEEILTEEETSAPNDAVILNYSQNPVTYKAVPKVWLTHPDSTEEAPVLVPFTYGELVEGTEIVPDFSAGDQEISVPDGYLVKEATIKKPENLLPENIRYGKEIAGVEGEFLGDAEEVSVGSVEDGDTYELDLSGGDMTVEASEGKTMSKVTIKKPADLAPENILSGKTIGGVDGSLVAAESEEVTVDGDGELTFADGNFVVEPTADGKLMSKVTIGKPSNLVPENIAEGVNVAGVEGTFVGGAAVNDEAFEQMVYRSITSAAGDFTTVGAYAFAACTKLTSVSFPECSIVNRGAFSGCTQLTSVSLPKCSTVWSGAFMGCTKLSAFSASSCYLIASYAFSGCSNLSSITLSDYAAIYSDAFSGAFNGQTLTISGRKILYSYCFRYCSMSRLELLNFSSIYPSAFANCYKLQDVFMSVQPAWTYMFMSCSSLQRVIAPNLRYIGSNAFYVCSNLRLFSGYYASYISSYAFYNCRKLSVLLFQSYSALTASLAANVFSYTPLVSTSLLGYYGSIYVPESLVSTYKADSYWKTYSARITSITDDILALFEGEL